VRPGAGSAVGAERPSAHRPSSSDGRDAAGQVDLLDNCPDTPNEPQVDSDGDHRGDACSGFLDGPVGLSASARDDGAVALSWEPVEGAGGYTLYRRGGNGTVYLGDDYPVTNRTRFVDGNASGEATYWVRPVNRATGLEGNRSMVTASVGPSAGTGVPPTAVAAAIAVAAVALLALVAVRRRRG